MADAFDKHADRFDIRDVIERFEELESLKEARDDAHAEYESAHADVTLASHGDGDPTGELNDRLNSALEALKGTQDDFSDEEHEEFLILLSFLEEVKGYGGDEQWRGDWYPLGFIHEDYFVEAMEELVKDIGDLPKDIPGYLAIDWNATAENLRVDYSSVEIDGETFWYR